MEILLLVLIGFTAGTLKGITSFGSSLIAIPLLYLAGFSVVDAVTMMITTNIILNILLIYENKSYFHFETIKKIYPIILGGVLFTAVGIYFNGMIDSYVIELIAALFILIAIINKITKLELNIKDNFINLFTVGVLSGIGNGLASIDGPPVLFYLSTTNAPKKRFKSTLATHFLIMGIIGVLISFLTGKYSTGLLVDTSILFVSLVSGLLFGMVVGKKLEEEQFQKVVLIILIGLAISLIIP